MKSEACIAHALNYLTTQQLEGGGFTSYTSFDLQQFTTDKPQRTSFAPALVLAALNECQRPVAVPIKAGLVQFLLAQKSPDASLNYWDRQSADYKKTPYPNDLDDTFCAWAALGVYDQTLIGGEVLAQLAQLLIACEEQAGGPYRTWLTRDGAAGAWRDVDLAVNANIGYFLRLQNVTLPKLTAFLRRSITKHQLSSPYYIGSAAIAYFIARNKLAPAAQSSLRSYILERQAEAGHWDNPLETALAVSSLLRLAYPRAKLKPALAYLAHCQRDDGSWPAAAFLIDSWQAGRRQYAGAAALTTAFCIEALSLYTPDLSPIRHHKQSKSSTYPAVKQAVQRVIVNLEQPDFRKHTQTVFKRLIKQDKDKQILLLPWLVAEMAGVSIDTPTAVNLGAASLWGWMAYTIYDDFLDGPADPRLLPSANFALRQLTATLRHTLNDNTAFQAETGAILTRIDAANAWETSHCRGSFQKHHLQIASLPDYGDYWQLADRSLGHSIAGLGALYAAGFAHQAPQMQALRDFFNHYLIARQLNDDAHDWEEDLQRGHINAVGVLILQLWAKLTGKNLQQGIETDQELEALRKIMWEDVILKVCELVLVHTTRARQALERPEAGFTVAVLSNLLVPLEEAVNKARQERLASLEFMSTFNKT